MNGLWTICRDHDGRFRDVKGPPCVLMPVVPCNDAAITAAVEALIGAPYDWRTYSPAQVVEVVARGLAGQSAEEIDAAYFRAAGETP